MSIINVLVLTIFISFLGSDNFIQAEITGDGDVERLNVPKGFVRYYRLLTTERENQTCSTNHTEQQSQGQYMMKAKLMYSPGGDIQFQDYSNIIVDTTGDALLAFIVIYKNNHPLYVQIPKINTPEQMWTGVKGQIYIIGRRESLPNGLLDHIKHSDIIGQGLGRDFGIYFVDIPDCSD